MKITDVVHNHTLIRQIAELLVDGFQDTGSESWETLDAASDEVRQSLGAGRISRVAIGENASVIGWIGGIAEYDGWVWELHPMVVHKSHRKRGIGRALVADFEEQVRRQGGSTIRIGTDDENKRTSIGGIDLYPDVLGHLSTITNLREHPYEFYLKLGYAITGVVPDANGFGKPDIMMAKRIV